MLPGSTMTNPDGSTCTADVRKKKPSADTVRLADPSSLPCTYTVPAVADVTPKNVALSPPSAFGSVETVTIAGSLLATTTSVGTSGAAVIVTCNGICRFFPTVACAMFMLGLTVASICPPLDGVVKPAGCTIATVVAPLPTG